MTPQFPLFKEIEIKDRESIKNFTKSDKPYSDFDFTTLWMWDIYGKRGWSELDGNLVVRFTGYLGEEEFYSIYGHNNIAKSIKVLLNFVKSQAKSSTLQLVPESVIDKIKEEDFLIEADKDNFDYIYAVEKLVTYPGYSYAQPRKMMNRFINNHDNIQIIPLDLKKDQENIKKLVSIWETKKKFGQYDERKAFERLLSNAHDFHLVNVGIVINDKLSAFTVNELVDDDFAISHFAKADTEHDGIYSYLMRETANVMAFQGCHFLNCEQDLGIPGLRFAKGSYRPEFFLKKYKISSKDKTFPGPVASNNDVIQ